MRALLWPLLEAVREVLHDITGADDRPTPYDVPLTVRELLALHHDPLDER